MTGVQTCALPISKQQVDVQQELKQHGDASQREMEEVVGKDVAAFNAMLREKKIPNLIVKAP